MFLIPYYTVVEVITPYILPAIFLIRIAVLDGISEDIEISFLPDFIMLLSI